MSQLTRLIKWECHASAISKEFIDFNQDDESHPLKFLILKEFKKRKARTRKEKKIEKESSRREISFLCIHIGLSLLFKNNNNNNLNDRKLIF